jgi:4-amino-4-deoxy-L-arabinose transferase-like glycosyltransferase
LCFAVFVGVRVLLLAAVPVEPNSDAAWYYNRAVELASSWTYHEKGVPTAYWPVGYPAFLALIFSMSGPSVLAGQLANLVLAAGSFLLAYAVTKQLLNDELSARLAVLLLTVYPNNIAYVPVLLTESLYLFLLLLATWLFFRTPSLLGVLATGVVLGLCTLVKAQSILFAFLLIPIGLWLWGRSVSRTRALLFAALIPVAAVLTVLPWSFRNVSTFGSFVLISTNGGMTLLSGNNPSARGDHTPDDSLVAQARFSVADQLEADRRARALALQWIRNNPVQALALAPMKVWRLWSRDGEAEWAYQEGTPSYERYSIVFRMIRVLNQAYYGLVLLAAGAGIYLLAHFGPHRPAPWFGVLVGIFITGIAVLFSGQSRFHFPAMPFLMMYAAWYLVGPRGILRRHMQQAAGPS